MKRPNRFYSTRPVGTLRLGESLQGHNQGREQDRARGYPDCT
jgi:hypothetical protein